MRAHRAQYLKISLRRIPVGPVTKQYFDKNFDKYFDFKLPGIVFYDEYEVTLKFLGKSHNLYFFETFGVLSVLCRSWVSNRSKTNWNLPRIIIRVDTAL